ncbi:probable F420-dependent oxidoreductase, Rv3093c family [Ferrithrix thermotolerans DSM 19514]|jgi:probable F420-dependent oxidoreductase|uniref:Probable F420-dependent oxidoreductase, Rv3093c family n=1 Tax=Ferrithrix thermotolerans DSM 19514 TaxID=1121881 RepID=A0A1M4V590_9ACTN|nr:LLM class F420-dependent oxidoreductase [Ferrithrix thermotolerans]SHE64090.1 probable F420-dependent oxidoreductase, Rv3093c family [Ferrithrix thermotolerans DSM 19514]
MGSYALTVPFSGTSLLDHKSIVQRAEELGYSEIWSSEVDGFDAFSPLVLAGCWSGSVRLGTAIVPAFTRGPATLAMSVAALCDVAPGRVSLGVGSSSNVIVERWNASSFEKPYQRTRDIVRFLREALQGDRVDRDYDTFSVSGFRLAKPPESQPEILVAALREQMLAMSSKEADGAILNWLSPDDVRFVRRYLNPDKKIVARVFVCPSRDIEAVRSGAKRLIAAYLNVPVYAEFHRWLGRGESLSSMWDNWTRGDRKQAVAQVPDDVVDELVVHGDPKTCKAKLDDYIEAGVDVAVAAFLPFGVSEPEALEALGQTFVA